MCDLSENIGAEVSKLVLNPGDTIVIRLKQPLPAMAIDRMAATLKGLYPENRVMILDRNASTLSSLAADPGAFEDAVLAVLERQQRLRPQLDHP